MKNFRVFLSLTGLAILGFGLQACEAVKGAGRSIEGAGEIIQDTATRQEVEKQQTARR